MAKKNSVSRSMYGEASVVEDVGEPNIAPGVSTHLPAVMTSSRAGGTRVLSRSSARK